MREYMGLFRGKRIDNGEWVEGCLLFDPDLGGAQIIGFEYWTSKTGIERGEFCKSVDPDTIGECTGLKDKNGKLIWEGDIVRVHGDDLPCWIDNGEIREVKYRNGAYTPFDEYDSDCGTYVLARDCEIIGNIHDNPELFKGGEGE